MMNICLVPMNSISAMIAEDAGAPELRNPLSGTMKKNRKRSMRKRPVYEITRKSLLEKLFS